MRPRSRSRTTASTSTAASTSRAPLRAVDLQPAQRLVASAPRRSPSSTSRSRCSTPPSTPATRRRRPQAVKKDYMRKLKELKYAITLEKKLTKDQILEGYLNLVYYGDRAYGVEAAAQHYFSVPRDKLSLSQAALLAGLTQNPGTTDPVNFPKKAVARRNVVLDRMHELGRITDKQWPAAKKRTLKQDMRVHAAQEHVPRVALPLLVRLHRQLRAGDARSSARRSRSASARSTAAASRSRRRSTRACSRSRSRRSPRRCRSATRARRRCGLRRRPQHRQGARLRPEHDLHRGQGVVAARRASTGPSTRSTAVPAASSSARRPRRSPS